MLVILERVGKAIRNPRRDVMLSQAGSQIGRGWAFGLHEALDQFGALFGPLLVALILAARNEFRVAFAVLAIPAAICILFVLLARRIYPRPDIMEPARDDVDAAKFRAAFRIYLLAAGLVAAGFVDYPLLAYHLETRTKVPSDLVPVFYALAMGVSGLGSLVFGRFYDRIGFPVVIVLTALTALFAPLLLLGDFRLALLGAALWGLGIGVHESLIPPGLRPWSYPHGELQHMGCSPADTASSGFSAALQSDFFTNTRFPQSLLCASLLSLPPSRSFCW